jgi:ectoine hydroxylase-related dioxygenase (phytanoyl-CoA dioxygenase family)
MHTISSILSEESLIKFYKNKFEEDGYVIFQTGVTEEFIDQIIKDLTFELSSSNELKLNPKIFHYNESPRIVELWKKSESAKALALNVEILKLLEIFYQSIPTPFSTINFVKSTEQPLHSDYVHFASKPDGYLAGVWVALQDINPNSGPLSIVPKSHALPIVTNRSLNLKTPKTTKEVKANYTVYENYLIQDLSKRNMKAVAPILRKGEALIWAANLAHGATKQIDSSLTRYSQVTHYHFKNAEFVYNPLYSDPENGSYALRNLVEMEIK